MYNSNKSKNSKKLFSKLVFPYLIGNIQSGHISVSDSMYLPRGSYPANVNALLVVI